MRNAGIKLLEARADAIEDDALNGSPTFRALQCTAGVQPRAELAALITAATRSTTLRC